MAAQLLHHLTPLDSLPPHSYTILPPLAAQLLHHVIPSEQATLSLLHHFTHCSPLLHGNFSQALIPEKSSHCSPFQPILTWKFWSVGVGA